MENGAKVFIAGVMTTAAGLVRLETLYEKIGSICESRNFKTFIPHRDANIRRIHDFTPQKLYLINMEKLVEVDLVIAYVGQPSTGVGMEIQQACVLGKDTILISEADSPVSMLLTGCPNIISHIRFKDFNEAASRLDETLLQWQNSRSQKVDSMRS
jgi:hypothetical protein